MTSPSHLLFLYLKSWLKTWRAHQHWRGHTNSHQLVQNNSRWNCNQKTSLGTNASTPPFVDHHALLPLYFAILDPNWNNFLQPTITVPKIVSSVAISRLAHNFSLSAYCEAIFAWLSHALSISNLTSSLANGSIRLDADSWASCTVPDDELPR